MLDAATKALSQMLSPPFRAVLLKAIGLAVVLLVVVAIGLHRLIAWLAGGGEAWLEGAIGPGAQAPLVVLSWILAIVATLGLFVGIVFLMPAVTAIVAVVAVFPAMSRARADNVWDPFAVAVVSHGIE